MCPAASIPEAEPDPPEEEPGIPEPASLILPPRPEERLAASITAAVEQLGPAGFADWAMRLLTGRARAGDPGDPDIALIGGHTGWMPYWSRVWGARALLYRWHPQAGGAVVDGLADEDWRVRAACVQVAGRHGLTAAGPALVGLLDDPSPQVRSEAARAVGEIGPIEAAEPLERLVMDPDSVLAGAAEDALQRLAERFDQPGLGPPTGY